MSRFLANGLVLGVAGVLMVACGDDDGGGGTESGSGTVNFTTWGEEYIEEEIPSAEFEDGWSAKFTKFLVVVGNVRVMDEGGAEAGALPGFQLIDYVDPGVKTFGELSDMAAATYPSVSWEIRPRPASDITLGAGADQTDLDMMADTYSVYVEGQITDGTTTKTFAWGFSEGTRLENCMGDKDGAEVAGVVVTNGGTDQVELTIHGDHFFYDDLQADTAVLRGQALADADADMDGVITLEELAAVPLASLPSDQYGTGSLSVVNLREFVAAQARTLGHFRGEGHCDIATP